MTQATPLHVLLLQRCNDSVTDPPHPTPSPPLKALTVNALSGDDRELWMRAIADKVQQLKDALVVLPKRKGTRCESTTQEASNPNFYWRSVQSIMTRSNMLCRSAYYSECGYSSSALP